MSKFVRDTAAGKSISAYVVLRPDGTHVATVHFHHANSGAVLCNVWNMGEDNPTNRKMIESENYGPQIARVRGYGYDKATASLAGMEIDGHKMTDHCQESLSKPEGRDTFPHDFVAPAGYSLANWSDEGYRSCHRKSGLDYLKAIGYTVIQAV